MGVVTLPRLLGRKSYCCDPIEMKEHLKMYSMFEKINKFLNLILQTGHTLALIILLYNDIKLVFIYEDID